MKAKRTLLILVGLSLIFLVGIFAYSQMAEIPLKMMVISGLIGIVAIFSIFLAMKKMKDEKEGQPLDDELTFQIKYKAGYYAYISSMYMWLFLFLFRGFFSDIETIVGGGVLLSGVIGFVCKMVVKQEINEK